MERDFEKSFCLGTGIPYMFLLLLTSFSNGLVLIALYRNPLRRFRKHFSVFLVFIAVVNLLNGLVVCSGEVIMRFMCAFGEGNIPREGDIVIVLEYIGINSSILLVTAMSVDRFVSVVYPHYYFREVKPRELVVCNIVICVFSSIFAALQLVPGLSMTVYRGIDVHMHSTFPLIINIFAYMGMFLFLKKRAREDFKRQTLTVTNAQLHDTQRLRRTQMERKFATTSFFILISLMLSLIPYFTVSALEAECYGCEGRNWFFVFKESCLLSLFLNSVLYPFLIAFRISDVKQSVKIVLCLRQRKDPKDFPLRTLRRPNKVIINSCNSCDH